MKKQCTFLVVTLLGLLLVSGSCQRSSDVTPPPPVVTTATQKGVSARINSQIWQTTAEQSTSGKAYYANRGGINPNELTIIGFGSFVGVSNPTSSDRITISLTNAPGVGTYQLAADNKAVYTATSGSLTNYGTDAARTGTVTITKYDLANGLLSGNFTFSAAAGSALITVTDGQFIDVPFAR